MDSLILNLPVAVAMITITKLLLDYFSSEKAKDRLLWENHLSKSVEVQSRTAEILTVLSTKIDLWGKFS